MNALGRDLSFAVRSLTKQPAFAVVAVVTLALGIGANAAIFSILNALVLRPLPYPDPDRLVSLISDGLEPANLPEWKAGVPALEAIGAYALASDVVTGAGPARTVRAMTVSEDFLGVLGAEPVRGRLFAESDHAVDGEPVALVSTTLWAALGGGERTTGVKFTFDGVAQTAVGVLSADFSFNRYQDIDVWLPMSSATGLRAAAIGRLAPGATVEQAAAQARALSRRFDPSVDEKDRVVRVIPMADVVESDVRRPLWVLFGAATLVLLIACANVANLLLSKATSRSAELAIRSSLGASRTDLVRQLLTENAVLALLGAGAGLVVATWTADLLTGLAPAYTPRIDEVGTDGIVLSFTVAIAVVATLAAGLAPALGATRASVGAPSSRRAATAGRGELRGRGILVSAQLALALIVLVASGLLIRTFLVLRPVSPGFETEDRIVARATLPVGDPERADAFLAGLAERVSAQPGGARAAAVTSLPLSGESMLFPVAEVDGRPFGQDDRPFMIHFRAATHDYMDVIGMPIARGRGLEPTDVRGARPVVVLNQNLAGRLFPDGDAIGRSVAFDLPQGPTEFAVVGVSADADIFGGTTGSQPEAFVSLAQSSWSRLRLVIHAPAGTLSEDRIREMAAAVDPLVPVEDFKSFATMTANSVSLQRFQMALMSLFGALAFVLSIIGCYSVLATTVAKRRREIGVRVALGATRVAVVSHIARGGIAFVLAGLVAGTIGALAASRLLAGVLYGVAPTDTVTFAAAIALLCVTASLAVVLPARRAASVQPAEVLRQD